MIYEVNGVRYKLKEKDAGQTHQSDNLPNIGHLQREFADHPSSGLTPAKLHALLVEAEQGNIMAQCHLADDIEEKDGLIAALMPQRKMAVCGVDFIIKPPRNATAQEEEDAKQLDDMLRDIDLNAISFDLMDGVMKGFSNVEFAWEYYRGKQVPTGFAHRNASWFQLNPENQNEIRLRDNSGNGEVLRPLNWLQHRHKYKTGYPARGGLVRPMAWSYVFKNYSARDLAEFLEIYGIPIRLGKYPSGATDGEKRKLLQAIMGIGHNAGGIIPMGMEIEIIKAAEGNSTNHMEMITWAEETITRLIMGQTLTSGTQGVGSQALGNVHNEVRHDIRDSDLTQIATTLNRDLILPMHMFNSKSWGGDIRRRPLLEFDTQEPADLESLSKSLPALTAQGMRISPQWLHEKTRIPMAAEGEEILGQAPQSQQPPEQKPTEQKKDADAPLTLSALSQAIAALKGRNPPDDNVTDDDVADAYARQLGKMMQAPMSTITADIGKVVQSATDLPSLLDDLLALDDSLSNDEIIDRLQDALIAAELAGRYEVSQGN